MGFNVRCHPKSGPYAIRLATNGINIAVWTLQLFKEATMLREPRGFVFRQDSLPVKVMYIEPQRLRSYMHRVQTRFSDYRWSVSERFPLSGSD